MLKSLHRAPSLGVRRIKSSSFLGCIRHYSPLPPRDRFPSDSYNGSRKYAKGNEQQYNANSTYPGYETSIYNPGGILQASDAVVDILSQPMLVMERRLELMNVFLGFEQASRYAIMDPLGNHLGYMEEEDFGITKAILRQIYRLHRPFKVGVYDRHGTRVLTIQRPFSFINSHIKAILPQHHHDNDIVIGETKQEWHPWRRRYNLFLTSG